MLSRSVLETASLTRSTTRSREDTSGLATGMITGDRWLHSTGPEKVGFHAKFGTTSSKRDTGRGLARNNFYFVIRNEYNTNMWEIWREYCAAGKQAIIVVQRCSILLDDISEELVQVELHGDDVVLEAGLALPSP